MHVFYCDPFAFPLPPQHRFPLAKYRLLRERVLQLPAGCGAELVLSPRVARDELLLVHAAAYVDDFVVGRLGAAAMQRIGFPWSPELVERTLRSTGGTVAAVRSACGLAGEAPRHAAVCLAGGTHHARRDAGAGYCVFHDCAVAARVALREGGARRVLIVDTDVHQGDGTAAIFAGDESVFTFSVHGEQNFPASKVDSDLDIALPDRCGDERFLAAIAAGLQQSCAEHQPDLVFHLAGADALAGDRLGRLQVSMAALQRRDELVLAAAAALGARVVTVMGGGYGRDLAATVAAQLHSVVATLGYERRLGEAGTGAGAACRVRPW